MKVPDLSECLALINEMEMLEHILSHSIQVCHVAVCISDALVQAGCLLDRELVQAAALLHDITKTRSLATGEEHALTGGKLLCDRGYIKTGEIVRQHVLLDSFAYDRPVSEAEIVNYADKRVLHDQIVPLDERMEYIVSHYGERFGIKKRLYLLWEETRLLESKLFSSLPFSPDMMGAVIKNRLIEGSLWAIL